LPSPASVASTVVQNQIIIANIKMYWLCCCEEHCRGTNTFIKL